MKATIYERFILDRTIRSCAVANKNLVSFITSSNNVDELPEEEREYPDQVFHYVLSVDSENPKDYGYIGGNLQEMSLDAVDWVGSRAVVGLTAFGEVYIYSKLYKGFECDLPDPPPPFTPPGTAHRIRKIGSHLYTAANSRVVHRRDAQGNWTFISHGAYGNDLDTFGGAIDGGFKDIDGFSETDIYAAGGKGHVWHYDGNTWKRIDIPTNADIYCLICASDGYVYIGGSRHLMLRGRAINGKLLAQFRIQRATLIL